LTQKRPASRIRAKVDDFRSGRNATIGGSNDTEVNEPTDIPTGPSSDIAVMMTTPVGTCPRTCLNHNGSVGSPVAVIGRLLEGNI